MGVTGGNIHTILLQEENIINVPPTIGFEQWFDMSDWKKKKAEGDQAYNEWFKAKMDDVIRRLRDPEHVEKYGQITELRKKLNVQYAVGRQQKLLNEHYTGRKWLGEKIDAWLEDPNAPRRCLVTGVPGVGKSAFAVHYAHYNPKTAAALFFSADMPNYNDPCVVIQTLAYLLRNLFPHDPSIERSTVLCGLGANLASLGIGGILCCFLPFWVSFLIVLVLTATAALLIPSQYSVCWARMLSIFCLLPIMMKFLGFELLTVGLPTAFFNVGFCLFLSYLSGPVLLELIFVTYLYQK